MCIIHNGSIINSYIIEPLTRPLLKHTLYYIHAWTSFLIATFRMIKSLIVHPGIFSFGLSWQEPEFFPDHYQFITNCRLFCARTDYRYIDIPIPRTETTLRVIDLSPGSVCRVNLKAVYNPASIDAGLTETLQTAFLRKFH